MSDRFDVNVKMSVTLPQALALREMFENWNRFSSYGSSRVIGFYVDGDGDFHPHCEFTSAEQLPDLEPGITGRQNMRTENVADDGEIRDCFYDFDPIGWSLDK